jgi:hypothetical protein
MSRGLRFTSLAAMPASMRERVQELRRWTGTEPVVIDLPFRAPLLNQWQRMHWAKRRRLGRFIAASIAQQCLAPPAPIARCVITVERTSTQEPDRDGLYGGLKPLLDALQPESKRHPYGLGFIADDNSRCVVDLIARHVQGRAEHTRITIVPLLASGQEETSHG